MTMTNAMWWAFDVLALISVFMTAERTLFLHKTKLADEVALMRRRQTWRLTSRCDDTLLEDLGWLNPLLSVSEHDPEKLWLHVRKMHRLTTRFSSLNRQVINWAMLIGLFGTMWGIMLNGGRGDARQMIAVGIGSSIYGLLIAISLDIVFGWLLRGRAVALAEQIEDVLDDLSTLLERLAAAKLRKTKPVGTGTSPAKPADLATIVRDEALDVVQAS